jgi:predicted nucleic acid-binding protein
VRKREAIVPDASVLIEMLLRSRDAASIQTRLLGGHATLHAPHLVDVEIAHVLRRYCARGEMTPGRGSEALDVLARFPLERYPHEPLLPRMWALRQNLTAYDAAYVALAEGLGATLITRDGALAKAAGNRATIELI